MSARPFEGLSEHLADLPIDARAEMIVEIFRLACREFALMVLEGAEAAPHLGEAPPGLPTCPCCGQDLPERRPGRFP